MIGDLGRPEKLALVIVAVGLTAGSVMWGIRWARSGRFKISNGVRIETAEESRGEQKPNEVIVYVTGAVVRPGVYRMPHGSRVFEAIRQAGGTTDEASLGGLNLAAPLADGEMLQIPAGTEEGVTVQSGDCRVAPSPGKGFRPPASSDGKVNINTAGAGLLESLPGIGPSLAVRIVDYRQKNGPFQTIDQLMSVPGIGPKKFADLKDRVAVR